MRHSQCNAPFLVDVPPGLRSFTFTCYPETRYADSSWPAIQTLLQQRSNMLPWGELGSRWLKDAWK